MKCNTVMKHFCLSLISQVKMLNFGLKDQTKFQITNFDKYNVIN